MTGFDHPEASPRLLGAVTVVLTAAAGALDAVTFFAFNEVFASTMTGNLILLGLDVGRGQWLGTIESLCAVLGYMVGLAAGTVIAGLVMRRLPWRSAVGVALTVELALLVALGLGYYGFTTPELESARAVLLVAGGAVAMGIQAAALRYVGPSGTPTNFLTGTVTNWVSAMVELHRPRWDGNSALRIVAVFVAAALGAIIQSAAPALTYALPVLLVLTGVVLMAKVTVDNHGGLAHGRAQFGDLDRMLDSLPADEEAPVDDPQIGGRVRDDDGAAVAAVLTVIDTEGRPVARDDTDAEGRYLVRLPLPGVYSVVCSPRRRATAVGPRLSTVEVGRASVVHDIAVERPRSEA